MHGARGTGGRSSKHRSLISSISRKKKIIKEISISLWLSPSRHPAFLQDWSKGWDCPALSTSISAAGYLSSQNSEEQRKILLWWMSEVFFQLITWRGDFVELIHHKELRILDKTTAIFSLILPFFAWSFGANSANCLNGVGTIPGVQVQSLNISLPRELSGGELWDSYLGKSTVTISQGRTQNQEMW